jgi:hypothetical protein
MRTLIPVLLGLAVTAPAWAAGTRSPEAVRPRVDHHLRRVEDLTRHFETVLSTACPRFATLGDWDRYLDAEVQRLILLMAHVEQAWIEAKTTGDDGVRRVAKEPRKRLERARVLLDKLSTCADDNGSPLNHLALWRRIERDVPQRQAEIALPQ